MTAPQHTPDEDPQALPPATELPSGESMVPVFNSAGLLQGGREIMIRHGSECYRLRHTRNDKLILTK